MSLLSDLINLNLSDTTEKVIAEYIWLVSFSVSLSHAVFFFGSIRTQTNTTTWEYVMFVSAWFFTCAGTFFLGWKKCFSCCVWFVFTNLLFDQWHLLGLTEEITLFLSSHEQNKVCNFSDEKMRGTKKIKSFIWSITPLYSILLPAFVPTLKKWP